MAGGAIRTEMRTVEAMIRIACADMHGSRGLCDRCAVLLRYAQQRLEACRFGDSKPTCAACTVHCYRRDMREQIRAVMRYAGPRMAYRHPLLALAHWLKEWRSRRGRLGEMARIESAGQIRTAQACGSRPQDSVGRGGQREQRARKAAEPPRWLAIDEKNSSIHPIIFEGLGRSLPANGTLAAQDGVPMNGGRTAR